MGAEDSRGERRAPGKTVQSLKFHSGWEEGWSHSEGSLSSRPPGLQTIPSTAGILDKMLLKATEILDTLLMGTPCRERLGSLHNPSSAAPSPLTFHSVYSRNCSHRSCLCPASGSSPAPRGRPPRSSVPSGSIFWGCCLIFTESVTMVYGGQGHFLKIVSVSGWWGVSVEHQPMHP